MCISVYVYVCVYMIDTQTLGWRYVNECACLWTCVCVEIIIYHWSLMCVTCLRMAFAYVHVCMYECRQNLCARVAPMACNPSAEGA